MILKERKVFLIAFFLWIICLIAGAVSLARAGTGWLPVDKRGTPIQGLAFDDIKETSATSGVINKDVTSVKLIRFKCTRSISYDYGLSPSWPVDAGNEEVLVIPDNKTNLRFNITSSATATTCRFQEGKK